MTAQAYFLCDGSAATNLIDVTTTGDATNTLTNVYMDNVNASSTVSTCGVINFMQYATYGLTSNSGLFV